MSKTTDRWLKDLQALAEQQASLLDSVVEALQKAQARVPETSREEIQALRAGRQSLGVPQR